MVRPRVFRRQQLTVEIAKRHIVDFFLVRGDLERAAKADEALPDPVDLGEHAEALARLGIDVGLLATQIANLEA